jgi:Mrp family chromosome partitioning ATPase/uncharacterized protein involved in exopolysaccharide biosynthesis
MWILILVPVIAAIAGYVFSLGAKEKYRSSALLATGYTTNEGIQITDERVDLWAAGVKFDNMIERMNSELVMALVSYQLIIHDLTSKTPFRKFEEKQNPIKGKSKEEINGIVELFKAKLEKMEMLSTFNQEENELIRLAESFGYAGWMLKANLSINRARSTDFVEVSFVSEDPFLSAFVVNTLSEEYIRYDSYLKSGISNKSVKFFSDLVDEKKKILDEKTKLLDTFKASNNLYDEDLTELKSTQLGEYEIMRQEKQNEIRSKQLSINHLNNQINNITQGKTESSSEINAKVLQIRSKINDLNQIYITGGSKDESLLATINSLRSQLQVEMNKLVVSSPDGTSTKVTKDDLIVKRRQLELELEIGIANLNSLDQTIYTLKSGVSGSASKKSTIEALNREVSTASDEYLQAVDKYNTEKNKSLISNSSISISQRAQPNGAPEPSKALLIIGLSAMASLSLCVFVIVLLEFIDQRLKNPTKFEAYANLNLLGWINTIHTETLDLRSLVRAKTNNESEEQFKHFLRKIRFEIENSGSQIILVTSPKKGEGKTFVILSLAYSLSLLNKRVLIIDTNFRNNSLTKLLIARPNFQKMLQEQGEVKLLTSPNSEPFDGTNVNGSANIISKTTDKNIDIIGSNTGLESPSEILAGRDFKNVINQLRSNYDYIFLEGSSLNDYSDAKELMTFADHMIAVFSASSIIKQIDKESITYMRNIDSKFLGAILNQVDAKEAL